MDWNLTITGIILILWSVYVFRKKRKYHLELSEATKVGAYVMFIGGCIAVILAIVIYLV
jgi:preprotein translocase subunit YajC